MKRFRAAHAAAQNWLEAGNKCLAQLGDIPPQANLGFLYTTDEFTADLPNILNFFKQRSGIEHWVGTVGMGICSAGQEYYDTPAVSVLIAEFPAKSMPNSSTRAKRPDSMHHHQKMSQQHVHLLASEQQALLQLLCQCRHRLLRWHQALP